MGIGSIGANVVFSRYGENRACLSALFGGFVFLRSVGELCGIHCHDTCRMRQQIFPSLSFPFLSFPFSNCPPSWYSHLFPSFTFCAPVSSSSLRHPRFYRTGAVVGWSSLFEWLLPFQHYPFRCFPFLMRHPPPLCIQRRAGCYKRIGQQSFPNGDRFLSILGSFASLCNASGRIVSGLSADRSEGQGCRFVSNRCFLLFHRAG